MNCMRKKLVIIDDERFILDAVKIALRKIDIDIEYFDDPLTALSYLKDNQPDMVISDQRMPRMLGTELLAKVRQWYPQTAAVLLSAYNDFEDVSKAFNDNTIQKYLSKPWDNKELAHLVSQTLKTEQEKSDSFSAELRSFHGMISHDDSMEKTFSQIRKASMSNIPVFITGETGTGKELAARACHNESARASESFVAVNCANFSDTLMESQLFGHVKGAFTGAVNNQRGLLAEANKGTLFMDEVTCLPLPLQAKLLRVLQEREFCPIGSNKVIKFEAQVVTASSVALNTAVQQGNFREDLYYRLNVIAIQLPRLAMRGGDAALLANYFLNKYADIAKKGKIRFTGSAMRTLNNYNWPGNIRQLENLVHSLVVLSESDEISDVDIAMHLPDYYDPQLALKVRKETVQPSFESKQNIQPLWVTEKKLIEDAIAHFDGNVPRASAALEVSPSTLYRKINAWKEQSMR